jgi:NTE family protein
MRGGRRFVDGGVIDNLPVSVASRGMDAVIAVDTGSTDLEPNDDIASAGFASIYMRAATTMMHALQLAPFSNWTRPPMILIRPKVSHIGWFSFTHTDELLDAGYQAAMDASQKAYPMTPVVEWSPADGDFVHHCPTLAIEATRLDLTAEHPQKTTVDPTSEPTTKTG